LSDHVEEDEEELHALKGEVKEDISSKKAAAHVCTTSKKSLKKDSIDDVTKRLENTVLASSANFSCTYIFP
jgi:hypothetical protein